MRKPTAITEDLSKKFRWLSLVATWAVVCIHSRTDRWAPGLNDWEDTLERAVLSVTSFAVPMFFVISGYLFVGSYEKYGWKGLLCRRLKSLYVPAVIWSFFGWFVCLPIRYYVGNPKPWYDVVAIPLLLRTTYEAGHFWYVRDLLVLIALAPAMAVVARKWWAFGVSMLLAVSCQFFDWPVRLFVPCAVLYFSYGALLSTREMARQNQMMLGMGVLGVVAYFVPHLDVLKPAIVISVVWFAYDWAKSHGRIDALPRFGLPLFVVYCMHLIVLDYVGGVLRVLLPVRPEIRLIAYAVMCLTFWLDLFVANWLRAKTPRLYEVISGGR